MTVSKYTAVHDCSHCAHRVESTATDSNRSSYTDIGNNNIIINFIRTSIQQTIQKERNTTYIHTTETIKMQLTTKRDWTVTGGKRKKNKPRHQQHV